MKIVGIDPSLTGTGLALVDFEARKVVSWTVVRTKPNPTLGLKSLQLAERLYEIARDVRRFIDAAPPSGIAIEAQVGASMGKASQGSTFKLGAAYGAVVGCLPMQPFLVMPQEVKRRLVGSTGASKADAWAAAKARVALPPNDSFKTIVALEAVLDAVAVAVAAESDIRRAAALVGGGAHGAP